MSRALAGGRLTAAALILCSLFALDPGRAEAQSTVENKIRISLDQSLFSLLSTDYEGVPDRQSQTSFGLLGRGFGLSVGASIGKMLFIGGRLQLEWAKDEGDNTELSWGLQPFAELMFADGAIVPFALAGIDIAGVVVTPDGADSVKANTFGFRFGGGAHFFLTDSFSLDPRVEFGWDTRIGEDDGDQDFSSIRFSIVVGFSGWFGGGSAAPTVGGNDGAMQPLPGDAPGSATVANSTTETLDFGDGVSATLYGVPGQNQMTVRFQRRGPAPVLQGCQQLVWQVDGQPAQMAVGYTPTQESSGVLETLEGTTASNNAALLGNARVVMLTVCGASFTLTPQHLQQLADFNQRLQGAAQPQQNDPWGQPAY